MTKQQLENEVLRLAAKITVLEMVSTHVVADWLKVAEDPAAAGEEIIKSGFAVDAELRSSFGEETVVLMVTEELTSLVERAVEIAERRRTKGKGA
jgi:hypothetical protein